MASEKRNRKCNFSSREEAALLQEINLKKEIINAKLSSKVSNKAKQAAWQGVADAVNSLGGIARTVSDCKARYVGLGINISENHDYLRTFFVKSVVEIL